MSEREKRTLSRADSIEALVGLVGMLACAGYRFGALVAVFAGSAALFIFAVWGRRIV
jgi:hypothetical protein